MPSSRQSRKRPWRGGHRELDETRARGGSWVETKRDGEWSVRAVTGAKVYRCPGCRREIPAGVHHLVVWSRDSIFGEQAALADRRHWHRSCWSSEA